MTTLILVGYLPALLSAAEDTLPPNTDIIIIDDPALADRPAINKALAGRPHVTLSRWPYPQAATADAWFHHHRDLTAAAVIPAVEYAVPFAARLAERYGAAGAGYGAAQLLRDKSQLRVVTAAAGLANPPHAVVTSLDDVHAFAAEHPGPLVLKPSNRQASVGTRIVRDHTDLAAAWTATTNLDEAAFVANHDLPLKIQIEQFIAGDEYSVEMLVHNGTPIFANTTGKLLYPGDRPVEHGHQVPPDTDPATTTQLIDATTTLIHIIGFTTGVAHCEWIVHNHTPYLVECAGRMPGDGIVELIDHAWQTNLLRRYLTLMLGQPDTTPPPATPPRAAAIVFPLIPAGTVTEITGIDESAAMPGVYLSLASVKPGDTVAELRSSWDRVVGTAATADTPTAALAAAQAAAAKIKIVTEPTSPHTPTGVG